MSALGVNSPSKEFFKLGVYSDEGFANGLVKHAGIVERAAADVGDAALETVRKSISYMGKIASSDIDVTPTIRPVLDLTEVKKGAGQISGLFSPKAISVRTSYSSAAEASIGYRNNQAATEERTLATHTESTTFIQNNYSPKALSSADIYRQTNNALSVAKGGLTSSVKHG
jgi:hypothetical protein